MVDDVLNKSYYVYQGMVWCQDCTTIWYNGYTHFNEMVISDDFKDFSLLVSTTVPFSKE
jgi:hypothetical protein